MSTLTLKNIPETLHEKLKASAAKNRRSLNSEILARLERDVSVPVVDSSRLARELKAFTDQLPYGDHRIGDRHNARGALDRRRYQRHSYCWVRGEHTEIDVMRHAGEALEHGEHAIADELIFDIVRGTTLTAYDAESWRLPRRSTLR